MKCNSLKTWFLFPMLFLVIFVNHAHAQFTSVQTFGEVNVIDPSEFGYSVSDAGDINGDGKDDVIVCNKSNEKVYVFHGGSPMDNEPVVVLSCPDGISYFGYSLSAAGDVNNDGYDDIIIGSNAEYKSDKTCAAYIYFGSSTGISNNSYLRVTNGKTGAYGTNYGSVVSNAGDVNNDGYDDVIIGSPRTCAWSSFTPGLVDVTGLAYLHLGGPNMNGSPDLVLYGPEDKSKETNFGEAVSAAGDVNNDGYDDLIVSDPWQEN